MTHLNSRVSYSQVVDVVSHRDVAGVLAEQFCKQRSINDDEIGLTFRKYSFKTIEISRHLLRKMGPHVRCAKDDNSMIKRDNQLNRKGKQHERTLKNGDALVHVVLGRLDEAVRERELGQVGWLTAADLRLVLVAETLENDR